jgi:radical SAM superfamily enzyme
MVIHRLTGDGAKRDLAAPLWSGDKKAVLNAISAALERDNVIQGELYTP